MKVLVTGAAGFIGFHTAKALLERGDQVVGIDLMTDYYDVDLKKARLSVLEEFVGFSFYKTDISKQDDVFSVILEHQDIEYIIHLAAQPGVRYSLENPYAYIETNVMGHLVMLEAALKCPDLQHFVYASSSSVYGENDRLPFNPDDCVIRPVSLYAATKASDELITRTYSHLHKLPATGLRFFTVYGPWGRPDMAAYSFVRDVMNDTPIKVFNHGDMRRDFTYIDDIVDGILSVLALPAAVGEVSKDELTVNNDHVPHRVYNLGNNKTECLKDFIEIIEATTGKKAQQVMEPMQKGDVLETYADISLSRNVFGFEPKVSLKEGMTRFVAWYRDFYNC